MREFDVAPRRSGLSYILPERGGVACFLVDARWFPLGNEEPAILFNKSRKRQGLQQKNGPPLRASGYLPWEIGIFSLSWNPDEHRVQRESSFGVIRWSGFGLRAVGFYASLATFRPQNFSIGSKSLSECNRGMLCSMATAAIMQSTDLRIVIPRRRRLRAQVAVSTLGLTWF